MTALVRCAQPSGRNTRLHTNADGCFSLKAARILQVQSFLEILMKSVVMEQETNPWESQAARFDLAAHKLNLDEGLWRVLRYPNREIILHIPVQMDDGHLEVFTGFRVQHSIARGPAKGGIRYSPDVTL